MHVAERPKTREALAATLGEAAGRGASVAFSGGDTKRGWDSRERETEVEISTLGLGEIVEHNAGDLTAVVEAGVPLARAQELFAEHGQMLALDPPGDGATLGGVVASADSGPLRGRYGGPRDLVVGMRVALSDGTIAKSGGKVIKNVAGYDLAKLFTGSFGTLGAILELSMRLHPLPPATVTAVGSAGDAGELARALIALSPAPLEHHGFDVRWASGQGALLVRFAGATPGPQAEGAGRLMREAGLHVELVEEDDGLWEEQRAGQRAAHPDAASVRVSGLPTRLPALLRAADRLGGAVVGRAALGLSWLRVPAPDAGALEALRRELSPSPCVVLDRPPGLDFDARGPLDPGAEGLMRRVKERFDPADIL